MKNKIRKAVNVLLGAMSVGVLGCKHPKAECLYGPPPPEDLYGPPMPEEMFMAKYGPPWMLNGQDDPNPIGAPAPEEEEEEELKNEN
jgi:hypothetical protein